MSATGPLKLVVMMPALDEAETLGAVIEAVPRQIEGVSDVVVLVINDGSTDDTERIAREKADLVLTHPRRQGLGKSFADGLDRALREGADIIVNVDADGQFDPADIPALLRPILDGQADFVTASRFARKDWTPQMPWIKRWGNRQMCRLVNFATGTTNLTDVSCGFRAFSAKAALSLQLSDPFTHTQETIIDLATKDVRIAELPLRVHGVRATGTSRVAGNLPAYAVKAGGRVLRTMCRTRPLFFFGWIGGVILGFGVLQGLIVFANWLFTRRTWPLRSLLLGAGVFMIIGFLVLLLALMADMLNRVVEINERLLYFAKLDHYRQARSDGRNAGSPGA